MHAGADLGGTIKSHEQSANIELPVTDNDNSLEGAEYIIIADSRPEKPFGCICCLGEGPPLASHHQFFSFQSSSACKFRLSAIGNLAKA